MSSSLLIESNNAIRHLIDRAYPRSRSLSNSEVDSSQSGFNRITETAAVSTTLSRDYSGSSIIDRGTIFLMATGGLASMSASSSAPSFDAYNSGAFIVSQTTRANQSDYLRVF